MNLQLLAYKAIALPLSYTSPLTPDAVVYSGSGGRTRTDSHNVRNRDVTVTLHLLVLTFVVAGVRVALTDLQVMGLMSLSCSIPAIVLTELASSASSNLVGCVGVEPTIYRLRGSYLTTWLTTHWWAAQGLNLDRSA